MDATLFMQIGIVVLINVAMVLLYLYFSRREDSENYGEAPPAPPVQKMVLKPVRTPVRKPEADSSSADTVVITAAGMQRELHKAPDFRGEAFINQEKTQIIKRQTLTDLKTRRK